MRSRDAAALEHFPKRLNSRASCAVVILRCEHAAVWLHASLEGWRPLVATSSDVAVTRPSPFEARPAEEPGERVRVTPQAVLRGTNYLLNPRQ
jgi:hypothetical protein